MRGFHYQEALREDIRLIQAVNLFAFPSGVQPVVRAGRKHWALGALTNIDMEYRLGGGRGKWLKRPRHSLHLYAPDCVYQGKHPQNDKGELKSTWLVFYADTDSSLYDICDAQGFAQIMDPQHRVIKLMNQCADICEKRKERGYAAAQAQLYHIIDRLLQSRVSEAGQRQIGLALKKNKTDVLVTAVRTYVREHLCELIRLEDLAAACHVSVSTLSHRYRELTGESPLATQAHLRMELAKQRLLLGEQVSSIAYQLGYADVYHFSKNFKKLLGVSPRNFVKQQQ